MGRYTSALDVFGRFIYASTFGSYLFVPESKFTEKDVPDLAGKVVIVTGGNVGIGKAICKVPHSRLPFGSNSVELITLCDVHWQVLLERNAKVYLAARTEARATAAIAKLLVETGKEAIWLKLDLSSLHSIERSVAEFYRYVVARTPLRSGLNCLKQRNRVTHPV